MTTPLPSHWDLEQAAPVAAETLLRVNIGCGIDAAPGWYNIDNSPTIWLSRVPGARRLFRTPAWPRSVHRRNALKGLPFGNETVDFIYSSHTLEHFTYEQSLGLAKECFRVLRPGGILRVVVPDLELIVRDYLGDSDSSASHRFIERLLLSHSWRDFLHPGAHHNQMFDARSLLAMLTAAGFKNAYRSRFGESKIPGLLEVELEQRQSESLYVEAEKRISQPQERYNRWCQEKLNDH